MPSSSEPKINESLLIQEESTNSPTIPKTSDFTDLGVSPLSDGYNTPESSPTTLKEESANPPKHNDTPHSEKASEQRSSSHEKGYYLRKARSVR